VFVLRSARFRHVARVFAVLLLVWTTTDLCGGVCVHDHEPIAAGLPSEAAGPTTISAAAGPSDTRPPTAPDDCFCCSHYVHPLARYQVVPSYTFIAAVEVRSASRPHSPASRLYHPPLA
jgi:hypothetical protein